MRRRSTQDKIGRALVAVAALLLALTILLLSGCTTTDPARYIERHCPVKFVAGKEAERIMDSRTFFDEKYCYVTSECWWNAVAISRWAERQGVECETYMTLSHMYVAPKNSRYLLDYMENMGIVRCKK